jgi:hypothetical protein
MSVESRLSYVSAPGAPSTSALEAAATRLGMRDADERDAGHLPLLDVEVPDAHAIGDVRVGQDPDAGGRLRLVSTSV